jgi:excisionase family DNA binding protein
MHSRHSVHDMQPSQNLPRGLLTAREVQDLLNIDRSTVYRMAEDGRLPAIRVGRSWRFPTERIEALLGAPAPEHAPLTVVPITHDVDRAAGGEAEPIEDDMPEAPGSATTVNTVTAAAAVDVAADLLGVMMVVTHMNGEPITDVTNPCPWFAEHGRDPEVLATCVAEWHNLADHPDLAPRFQPGQLGFECARAFIRQGTTLVGMVLAGGVSPSADEAADPGLYHLDDAQRSRVLSALPRIAAAISPTTPRPAASTPTAPGSGAAMKED